MVLFVSASTFGLDNIVLDDFENGLVNFTTEVNVNPPASMDIAVVDNPVKAGINTSNKVWEWKRYDASPDPNQPWAGFYAELTEDVPSGYHRIEVKFLRTNATSQLRIKCEGTITKEFDALNSATKTNEWETIVFDIYENGIKNIHVIGFFPDYFEPVDPTSISYIDDITVIYDESIVPPPTPAILTLFDNSASDRFHDQSWVNQTAPSTVVTEHWEGPNLPDGDKLPVVTSPVKAGANALKLQWKSVETGTWKAMTASIGWLSFDLTDKTLLRFWINSPVALDKSLLPKVYLEAFGGTPNVTGQVMLADYLSGNLVADSWTEVVIPLVDLWDADPAFTGKDIIKDVFFEQNTADNVEHTLFMDEFTFERISPSLVLFESSANDRFHDQSWISQTAPSTVATEHWEGPNMPNGDKFPCTTSPLSVGNNALKLEWKSVEAGNWLALVAAVGWTSFDLTEMTHLKFWVNPSVTIAHSALPMLHLEAHSGDPNATGKVPMSDYVTGDISANIWTEVVVSLNDLWTANAAFIAKDVIKGLFFSQNVADNALHTMYMDNFTFVQDNSLRTITPVKDKLYAYYNNGEIYIGDYNGKVQIINLAGQVVSAGYAQNGIYPIAPKQGIYIIKTTVGSVKIAIR